MGLENSLLVMWGLSFLAVKLFSHYGHLSIGQQPRLLRLVRKWVWFVMNLHMMAAMALVKLEASKHT